MDNENCICCFAQKNSSCRACGCTRLLFETGSKHWSRSLTTMTAHGHTCATRGTEADLGTLQATGRAIDYHFRRKGLAWMAYVHIG